MELISVAFESHHQMKIVCAILRFAPRFVEFIELNDI